MLVMLTLILYPLIMIFVYLAKIAGVMGQEVAVIPALIEGIEAGFEWIYEIKAQFILNVFRLLALLRSYAHFPFSPG